MKIKHDEAGRLSVTDIVWELSVRASVRIRAHTTLRTLTRFLKRTLNRHPYPDTLTRPA